MKRISYIAACMICLAACSSDHHPAEEQPAEVVEQELAASVGFFADAWKERTLGLPAYAETSKPTGKATVTVQVDMSNIPNKILPSLFGNNANAYMGQVPNEPVLLDYIKNLSPNIIRFPGGNLSSVYFWNAQPGNLPADAPEYLLDEHGNAVKAGYWYGKSQEGWVLSLDNYYLMLEKTGNKGMITVNYGYARYGTGTDPVATAAHLAADWVRYDKGRTVYWEIGNESGGTWQAGYRIDTNINQDGQPGTISGTLYGQHVKIFADSMRQAAKDIDADIKIGAQLIQTSPEKTWFELDKTWNNEYFAVAGETADFYIVHDYYTPYNENSTVSEILKTADTETQAVMNWMEKTTSQGGVSLKPIAMTEWNIFATGSQQIVSYIAGVHAVLTLCEMMKTKFGAACRWDLVNGWDNGNDHGMFSSGDEPDNPTKWNPRPVFYYMYYLQKYFGDKLVTSTVTGSNDVVAYASSFSSGQAAVVIVNKGNAAQTAAVDIKNFKVGKRYYWYALTGGTDNGNFSRKVYVNGNGPSGASGGPASYASIKALSCTADNNIIVELPALTVAYVMVDRE